MMNPINHPSPKVRTQNIRDFTVKICHVETGSTVGTGFLVSRDGKILTCAHVVRDASLAKRNLQGVEVGVRFPKRIARIKEGIAKVIAYFPHSHDDVILLQTVDASLALLPHNIAVLGVAEKSFGHPFESYGYRRLAKYQAGRTEGKILGDVEPPENYLLKADPVQLKSSEITTGMSGAAVLDVSHSRNLVVGIVSETWFSDDSQKDRDTAWAVNVSVLRHPPFSLLIQDSPVPLKEGPTPKTDAVIAKANVADNLPFDLTRAPAVLDEWVGRDELLNKLNEDWANSKQFLTGLVGFGGEGKSSLARKWVEALLSSKALPRPDGIFWWGFYENRDVEQFFEAALRYLSPGRINPMKLTSAYVKAQVIGAMLETGRYLFILDGLEVLQHSQGDDFGLLNNESLNELFSYFAAGGHQSFCLVTSRFPLLGFIDYITCKNRDVNRLTTIDGRNLLRKIGVKGNNLQLEELSRAWGEHALTLSLLGTYLTEYCSSHIKNSTDILTTEEDSYYSRIHRILRWYDNHLSVQEQAFMRIFSAFRLPVSQEALESSVFRQGKELAEKLTKLRILIYKPQEKTYNAHPLVQEYYLNILERNRTKFRAAHLRIKDYYLSSFLKEKDHFSIKVMSLVIEIAHHFCKAERYDKGIEVAYDLSLRRSRDNILTHFLGAYETQLELMKEFFVGNDFHSRLLVNDSDIAFPSLVRCNSSSG